MALLAAILSEVEVPFPPEHEKKSLTRAGARDRLIRSREPGAGSREPGAYGFVMAAGAFHASAERAVPARLLA